MLRIKRNARRTVVGLVVLAMLSTAIVLAPSSTRVALADENPATEPLTQDCEADPAITELNQSGVQAVTIGETVTFSQSVQLEAGGVFQDILLDPNGDPFYASYLELEQLIDTDPGSFLQLSAGPFVEVDGVALPTIVGTQPDANNFVLHSLTSAGGGSVWRLYFPGDVAAMLADEAGEGQLSYVVGTAGETFTMSFDAQVLDQPAVVAGVVLDGAACYAQISSGPSNRNTDRPMVSVAVAEPVLDLVKDSEAVGGFVTPEGFVNYTITVTNEGADATGVLLTPPAYEVVIVDDLDPNIMPLDAADVPLTNGGSTPSGGVYDSGNHTLTWTDIGTILPGDSASRDYRVQVAPGLAGNTDIINVAVVDWYSLPGNGSGTGLGAFYDDGATDDEVLTVAGASPLIAKRGIYDERGIATTFSYPDSTDVGGPLPINYEFTQEVLVTLEPDSAHFNMTVQDVLPDGLTFVSMDDATCEIVGAGLGSCDAPDLQTLTPAELASGTTPLMWFFGDIVTGAAAWEYVFTYTVKIDPAYISEAGVALDDELVNTVDLYWNLVDRFGEGVEPSPGGIPDNWDGQQSDTSTVAHGRPILSITKVDQVAVEPADLSPQRGPVYWDFTVTNSGNLNAYNIDILDEPSADISNMQITTASTAVNTTADGFNIPGPLAPGATATFTVRTYIDGQEDSLQATINNADITCYRDNFDRDAQIDDIRPCYSDVESTGDAVTYLYPEVTIDKSLVDVDPPQEQDSPFSTGIGGPVWFEIEVQNDGEGTAWNLQLEDTAPAGMCASADHGFLALDGVTPVTGLSYSNTTSNSFYINGVPNLSPTDNATGGSDEFSFLYAIAPCGALADNPQLENRIDLTYEDGLDNSALDGEDYADDATDNFGVASPTLAISKSVEEDEVDLDVDLDDGEWNTVTWTLEVTNTSNSQWAYTVNVTDTVPLGLVTDFADAIADVDQISADVAMTDNSTNGTNLAFVIDKLAPGETATITIPTYQDGQIPPLGGAAQRVLVNTSSVSSMNAVCDLNEVCTDTASVNMNVPWISPSIEKVVDDGDADPAAGVPGATGLDYTITVTVPDNDPEGTYDLWVKDIVPHGIVMDEATIAVACAGTGCPATAPASLGLIATAADYYEEYAFFLGDVGVGGATFTITYTGSVLQNFADGSIVLDGATYEYTLDGDLVERFAATPLRNDAELFYNRPEIVGGQGDVLTSDPYGEDGDTDDTTHASADGSEVDNATYEIEVPLLVIDKTVERFRPDETDVFAIPTSSSVVFGQAWRNTYTGINFSQRNYWDAENDETWPAAEVGDWFKYVVEVENRGTRDGYNVTFDDDLTLNGAMVVNVASVTTSVGTSTDPAVPALATPALAAAAATTVTGICTYNNGGTAGILRTEIADDTIDCFDNTGLAGGESIFLTYWAQTQVSDQLDSYGTAGAGVPGSASPDRLLNEANLTTYNATATPGGFTGPAVSDDVEFMVFTPLVDINYVQPGNLCPGNGGTLNDDGTRDYRFRVQVQNGYSSPEGGDSPYWGWGGYTYRPGPRAFIPTDPNSDYATGYDQVITLDLAPGMEYLPGGSTISLSTVTSGTEPLSDPTITGDVATGLTLVWDSTTGAWPNLTDEFPVAANNYWNTSGGDRYQEIYFDIRLPDGENWGQSWGKAEVAMKDQFGNSFRSNDLYEYRVGDPESCGGATGESFYKTPDLGSGGSTYDQYRLDADDEYENFSLNYRINTDKPQTWFVDYLPPEFTYAGDPTNSSTFLIDPTTTIPTAMWANGGTDFADDMQTVVYDSPNPGETTIYYGPFDLDINVDNTTNNGTVTFGVNVPVRRTLPYDEDTSPGVFQNTSSIMVGPDIDNLTAVRSDDGELYIPPPPQIPSVNKRLLNWEPCDNAPTNQCAVYGDTAQYEIVMSLPKFAQGYDLVLGDAMHLSNNTGEPDWGAVTNLTINCYEQVVGGDVCDHDDDGTPDYDFTAAAALPLQPGMQLPSIPNKPGATDDSSYDGAFGWYLGDFVEAEDGHNRLFVVTFDLPAPSETGPINYTELVDYNRALVRWDDNVSGYWDTYWDTYNPATNLGTMDQIYNDPTNHWAYSWWYNHSGSLNGQDTVTVRVGRPDVNLTKYCTPLVPLQDSSLLVGSDNLLATLPGVPNANCVLSVVNSTNFDALNVDVDENNPSTNVYQYPRESFSAGGLPPLEWEVTSMLQGAGLVSAPSAGATTGSLGDFSWHIDKIEAGETIEIEFEARIDYSSVTYTGDPESAYQWRFYNYASIPGTYTDDPSQYTATLDRLGPMVVPYGDSGADYLYGLRPKVGVTKFPTSIADNWAFYTPFNANGLRMLMGDCDNYWNYSGPSPSGTSNSEDARSCWYTAGTDWYEGDGYDHQLVPESTMEWGLGFHVHLAEQISEIRITDSLPFGMTYVPGSARLADLNNPGTFTTLAEPVVTPATNACNAGGEHADGGDQLSWTFGPASGDPALQALWSNDAATKTAAGFQYGTNNGMGHYGAITFEVEITDYDTMMTCYDADIGRWDWYENNVTIDADHIVDSAYADDWDLSDNAFVRMPFRDGISLDKTPDAALAISGTTPDFVIEITNHTRDLTYTDITISDTLDMTSDSFNQWRDNAACVADPTTCVWIEVVETAQLGFVPAFTEESVTWTAGPPNGFVDIVWKIGALPPETTVRIHMPIETDRDTPTDTEWLNSVIIDSPDMYEPLSEEADISLVRPSPPPPVIKSGFPNGTIGTEFEVTIDVILEMNEAWLDLAMVDLIPDGLEWLRDTGHTCAYTDGPLAGTECDTTFVTEMPLVLNADGSTSLGWWFDDVTGDRYNERTHSFTYLVKVDQEFNDGTPLDFNDELTNTAWTVSHDYLDWVAGPTTPELDPNEVIDNLNDFSSWPPEIGELTTEIGEPDLQLVHTMDFITGSAPLEPGDVLLYTVVVSNVGDWPAYLVPINILPSTAVIVDNASITTTIDDGTGPVPFTGAALIDGWTELDPGLTFFAGSIGELGDPDSTDVITITFEATVTNEFITEGLLTIDSFAEIPGFQNDAAIFTEPGRAYDPLLEGATTVLAAAPELSIEKYIGDCATESEEVIGGSTSSWCIVVANNGGNTAYQAAINELLPFGWSYEAGTSVVTPAIVGEPTVTVVGESELLTWDLGDLELGEGVTIVFDATVSTDAPRNGVNVSSITAKMRVAGDNGPEYVTPGFATQGYRASDTASKTLSAFHQDLAKGVGDPYDPAVGVVETAVYEECAESPTYAGGCAVEWYLLVNNEGTSALTDLVVTDYLPAGMTYVAGDATSVPAFAMTETSVGAGPAGTTEIVWTIDSLAPGDEVIITLPTTVDAGQPHGTEFLNHSELYSFEISTPVENQAKATITQESVPPTIEKTVDTDERAEGDVFTYTLTVDLPGPQVQGLHDIVVTDVLPAGLTFVGTTSGTTQIAPVANADTSTDLGWWIGSIEPIPANGTQIVITYEAYGTADAVDVGALTNSAQVLSSITEQLTGPPTEPPTEPGPNDPWDYISDPVTVDVEVFAPVLTIDKDISCDPEAQPGDGDDECLAIIGQTVLYTITVTNDGTWPAYDLDVEDLIPEELDTVTMLSGNPGTLTDDWTAADPDVVWSIDGPLAVGDSITFEYTAVVASAPAPADPLAGSGGGVGTNLITNGTFDNGLTSWLDSSGGSPTVGLAECGVGTSNALTLNQPSEYASQTVGTLPNETPITIEFDWGMDATGTSSDAVVYFQANGSFTQFNFVDDLTNTTATGTYTHDLSYAAGQNLIIYFQLLGGGGCIEIDNVSIIAGNPAVPDGVINNLAVVSEYWGVEVQDEPSHVSYETGTDAVALTVIEPEIDIEKSTNGHDSDVAPGQAIEPGDPVTWTYTVRNTGTVTLIDSLVSDSDATVDIDCGDSTNHIAVLIPGEIHICTATGVAGTGQYMNTGTVEGEPAEPGDTPGTWQAILGLDPISATDDSHYYGADASIDIEKSTNNVDADTGTGPFLAPAAAVTWTYTVTNDGDMPLTDVTVTDSDPSITIDCGSGTNIIDLLVPNSGTVCTATGTAAVGLYENLGTATGTPSWPTNPDGIDPTNPANFPADAALYGTSAGYEDVEDEDYSHYTAADGAVIIEKYTNGVDADTATGPVVDIGSTVTWTYVVVNTSTTDLINVAVTDNDATVVIDCGNQTNLIAELAPDEAHYCTATGIAQAGQYTNTGSTTGTPAAPGATGALEPIEGAPEATDSDDSHYFGADADIDIEKTTNGQDADTPVGPILTPGDTVTWEYTVVNTGDVDLIDVVVTDSDSTITVDCDNTGSATIAHMAPGATIVCEATGTAAPSQLAGYSNLGSVTGTPAQPDPGGQFYATGQDDVADEDWSHYVAHDGEIFIEKSTNNVDADAAPGPTVNIGSTVTWTYNVMNTSDTELINVIVTDSDASVAVDCGDGSSNAGTLQPGEQHVCTATGTAQAGQYMNTATVNGTPAISGTPIAGVTDVMDTDDSHYFGADASIDIEKSTNGDDADTAPGPLLAPGDVVTWTYVVINDGDVDLIDVTVTDDDASLTVDCDNTGSATIAQLLAGETVSCVATGTAVGGSYANLGTATGTPAADDGSGTLVATGQDAPVDEDPSHYVAVDAGVSIEKSTNGVDADAAPGVFADIGSTVTWSYVVTNTASTTLIDVLVTDDDPTVVIDCGDGTNHIDELIAGEIHACTATGVAQAGQYMNTGTVVATPAIDGEPIDGVSDVTDTDDSHYFGADAEIDIEKDTNGDDADMPVGPILAPGDVVTWTYVVTNTGDVDLINVDVTDNDTSLVLDCDNTGTATIAVLPVGASVDCVATGTAVAGSYSNIGTATGTPASLNIAGTYDPTGQDAPVDTDMSHYVAHDGEVLIEKSTNGSDSDDAPGSTIDIGSTVTWTYVVVNTSDTELINVIVSDNDPTVSIDCGDGSSNAGTLQPGEQHTCTATGTAQAGQYANTGTVTGTPAIDGVAIDGATDATDTDDSHYFGADASIDIEKATNGVDADAGPGPYVAPNDVVTWTYVVTNTGDLPLGDLEVTDSDASLTLTCTLLATEVLLPGASTDCVATGSAEIVLYENLGSVTGTPLWPTNPTDPISWPADRADYDVPADFDDVMDEDYSHYVSHDGAVMIEKATNGVDADTAPGVVLDPGSDVTWAYVVVNTSDTTLMDVIVSDNDASISVDCGDGTNVVAVLIPAAQATCTATGVATTGQYANIGAVTGQPAVLVDGDWVEIPDAAPATDEDPSHYLGAAASVDIEKDTNGSDSDEPFGDVLAVGAAVTWTYVVTNDGDLPLIDLTVTDDDAALTLDCEGTGTDVVAALAVGASATCEATGSAVEGAYANTGMVSATPADPITNLATGQDDVIDEDMSHYVAHDGDVLIEKSTNGVDADTAPGVVIDPGADVTWTYVVVNTSDTTLVEVIVSDNDASVSVDCGDGSNNAGTLQPGEQHTCTATGTAATGAYDNIGAVTGQPAVDIDGEWVAVPGATPATDTDPSNYLGAVASVDIEKATNGIDADEQYDLLLAVNDSVTWTYVVTNDGDVPLADVTVTDDDSSLTVDCVGSGTNVVPLLPVGLTATCVATGTAVGGAYANLGSVSGTPADPATNTPTGQDGVTDEDPSHYVAIDASIEIEKATNGVDADTAPGVVLDPGAPVTWTYVVTNTGEVPLVEVLVTDDDPAVTVDCGDGSNRIAVLMPDVEFTCTASGTAADGAYVNTADVTAEPALENDDGTFDAVPGSAEVTDDDPSNHLGAVASVAIEKATNGADSDDPFGEVLAIGDAITWTYVITNDGDLPLADVTVTDDDTALVLDCESTGTNVVAALAAGASATCEATGNAAEGAYANIGMVTGTPLVPGTTTPTGQDDVIDEDMSHYVASDGAIMIEKYTNGIDADAAPGVVVDPGTDITWTYVVVNTSDTTLMDVVVSDNDASISVDCGDGSNNAGVLQPGEQHTCTATGVATTGQYANTGAVNALPAILVDGEWVEIPDADPATDTDLSHYLGAVASVAIEKDTNGSDSDEPFGDVLAIGEAITWTYVVTNDGDLPLIDLTVTDDDAALTLDCDSSGSNTVALLAVGASVTCEATGTSVEGGYANTGMVTATPADPVTNLATGQADVDDEDMSHYVATDGAIVIEKSTNGVDADTAPGVVIDPGADVTWTYVVMNTSDSTLIDVIVSDNDASISVDCGDGTNVVAVLIPAAQATCTATGTATAGAYDNIGAATGQPAVEVDGEWVAIPDADPATDTDPSNYLGAVASVAIEKATNGNDADEQYELMLAVGDNVTWTYVVTNDGDVPLADVTVTDDDSSLTVDCESSGTNMVAVLAVGASATCEATGTAVDGAYANLGMVTATPADPATNAPTGQAGVTDEDPSHYVAIDASVDIEKYTNNIDADTAPGPVVDPGTAVTWTYEVKNTGTVTLVDVIVDDSDVSINVDCGDQTNLIDELAGGETAYCTASGTAQSGQYMNDSTVTGTPAVEVDGELEEVPGAPAATDDDSSHYLGAVASVDIEKATNGVDADEPYDVLLTVGDDITWTYVVTNDGDLPLADVTVSDDDAALVVDCDNSGSNTIALLAVGDSVTCEATGTASDGGYVNTGTVTGTPVDPVTNTPTGQEEVVDEDMSHYVASDGAIVIEKFTNGVDADATPGVVVDPGADITWTYVVVNTSDTTLVDVIVSDDDAAISVDCGDGSNNAGTLQPGEQHTCSATGVAISGQYSNIGSVTGDPAVEVDGEWVAIPDADPATDTDPSNYLGAESTISIEKATNGVDADEQYDLLLDVGDDVTWTYVVTNDGGLPLIDVTVTDDDSSLTIDCEGSGTNTVASLAVGASATCEATGIAAEGIYQNIGMVTGTPVDPATNQPTGQDDVSDDDESHYAASAGAIMIEKYTNGIDADAAPGVVIDPGTPVTWSYIVTNMSDTTLVSVIVSDDDVAVAVDCGDGSNNAGVLEPGEQHVCTASGTATSGQYSNTGSVSAQPAANIDGEWVAIPGADPATDDDLSHYLGALASVGIEKATNGVDADEQYDLLLVDGDDVTWTYVVTNTGEVPLADVVVTDDDTSLSVDCGAGSDTIGLLAVGDSVTCTAMGTAVSGSYANVGTVAGTPADPATNTPTGQDAVTDEDKSHYVAVVSSVTVEKYTNGVDADAAPGVVVEPGSEVTWTYVVHNTGEVPLVDVIVSDDDPAVTIDCGDSSNRIAVIRPDVERTCTATGTAVAGGYVNVADVTGEPALEDDEGDFDPIPGAAPATDDDPSNYSGLTASVSLDKKTNGVDAAGPYDLLLSIGDAVTWTYEVTNDGELPLADVTVTDDDPAVAVICPDGTNVIALVLPGNTATCEATGVAVNGDYRNVGSAEGTPVFPADPADDGSTDPGDYESIGYDNVDDSDVSHYVAHDGAVMIQTATNTVDADNGPGPMIAPGDPVTWTYHVTNTSNTPLINLVVSDSQGEVPQCGNGRSVIDLLLPSETAVCTVVSVSGSGLYGTVGAVRATPAELVEPGVYAPIPSADAVTDTDPTHHYGGTASIDIELDTNGVQSDDPSGEQILEDQVTEWSYVVTNTGSVPLIDIVLGGDCETTDADGNIVDSAPALPSTGSAAALADSCLDGLTLPSLAPGETYTWTSSDLAGIYDHARLGTVTGVPAYMDDNGVLVAVPDMDEVDDEDWTHHQGTAIFFDLALVKKILSSEADGGGEEAKYSIEVINQGTTDAQDVVIADYLPENTFLDDIAWSGDGEYGGTATYRIPGTIRAGESVTVGITIAVRSPGKVVRNVAEILSAVPHHPDTGEVLDVEDVDSVFGEGGAGGVMVDDEIDNEGGDIDASDLATFTASASVGTPGTPIDNTVTGTVPSVAGSSTPRGNASADDQVQGATTSRGNGGPLALTGSNSGQLALLGSLMVLMGAAMVGLSKRRRNDDVVVGAAVTPTE